MHFALAQTVLANMNANLNENSQCTTMYMKS